MLENRIYEELVRYRYLDRFTAAVLQISVRFPTAYYDNEGTDTNTEAPQLGKPFTPPHLQTLLFAIH